MCLRDPHNSRESLSYWLVLSCGVRRPGLNHTPGLHVESLRAIKSDLYELNPVWGPALALSAKKSQLIHPSFPKYLQMK